MNKTAQVDPHRIGNAVRNKSVAIDKFIPVALWGSTYTLSKRCDSYQLLELVL